MLIETQKGGGLGGEHTATLAEELKITRIEAKKLESDRDRFREMHERAEATVQRLDDRVAQLEVDLRESNDKRTTATSSQSIVEESLAKAEVARAKAAEEALDAAKARDEASAAAEAARRESDRLRRRLDALEQAGTVQGGDDSGEIRAENDGLKRKLRLAQDQANDLERAVGSLKAELDAAQADAKAARAAADAAQARASQSGGSTGSSSGAADNDLTAAIREKASDVYDSINDILSEIRNNVKLVQDEFGTMAGGSSEDSVRIISDTIQTLIDSAEDAKGVLRGLREVVELT
jgi:membrane protein involved in colicin uptake